MHEERRRARMDRRRTLTPRRNVDRLGDAAGAALPPPPPPAVTPKPAQLGELSMLPVAWCGAGALLQVLNLDGTKCGVPVAIPPGSFVAAIPPPAGEQICRAAGILPQLVGQRNGPAGRIVTP